MTTPMAGGLRVNLALVCARPARVDGGHHEGGSSGRGPQSGAWRWGDPGLDTGGHAVAERLKI